MLRRWIVPFAGAAVLVAAAGQVSAYQGSAALRMSVTVLPFIAQAAGGAARPAVTGDDDGYGLTAARVKGQGQGPSAVLTAALNSSGKLVAYASQGKPLNEAPVQVQAVVMAFEHRQSRSGSWEAAAELAVRVADSVSGTELFTDFYRGKAPARGPIPKTTAAYILQQGITHYKTTPLGKAFYTAIGNALTGAPEPEQRAQNLGIVPGVSRLAWQARVTGKQGARFAINAGQQNGLKPGQSLLPYQVKLARVTAVGRGAPGSYRPLTGALKVASLTPNSALLDGTAGDLTAGGAVLASAITSATAARSLQYVEGNAPQNLREAFTYAVGTFLDLQEKQLGLKGNQLVVKGTCHLESGDRVAGSDGLPLWQSGGKLDVNLELLEGEGGPVLARHALRGPAENYLQIADQVQTVFLRQILQRWPVPLGRVAARSIDGATQVGWTNAAMLQAAVGVPAFPLQIRFVTPPNQQGAVPIYHEGEAVEMECTAERDCYGIIYNVDPVGEVQRLWPARDGRVGFLKARQASPVPETGFRGYTVNRNLGQESVVVIAFDRETPVRQVLEAKPADLKQLLTAVRAAVSRFGGGGFVSAEPGGGAPLAQVDPETKQQVLGFSTAYAGAYSLVPLNFYTEPRGR